MTPREFFFLGPLPFHIWQTSMLYFYFFSSDVRWVVETSILYKAMDVLSVMYVMYVQCNKYATNKCYI